MEGKAFGLRIFVIIRATSVVERRKEGGKEGIIRRSITV